MRFLHHKSHREKKASSGKLFSSLRKASRRDRLVSVQDEGAAKPAMGGVVFLWGLLSVTVVYVAFFSPYLSVASVGVSGSESVRDQARGFLGGRISGKYFGLVPRSNFFIIRTGTLEAELRREYPLLREARIEKIFPDRLTATIARRGEVLLWCSGGPCYLLDEEGRASDSARLYSDGEPVEVWTVTDMSAKPSGFDENVVDGHFVSFAMALPQAFRETTGLELLREFSTSSRFAEELRVRTTEGWEIFFPTDVPVETSLKALKLLLDKEIVSDEKRKLLAYVDLRAENRIYYVMKGEEKKEEDGDGKKSEEKTPKKDEKKKKK